MSFGDLQTRAGIQTLNNFLANKSYIEGYQPTQADVSVFGSLKKAPEADLFHALRWYNHINSFNKQEREKFGKSSGAAPAAAASKQDDDDDFDPFASDEEEDAEKEKRKEERVKAYTDKKSTKAAIIAKSTIIMDVKPWDDETDMKKLEESVRSIAMDGLLWGTSKLVPVAYGVKKLQITCVIEDDKVSTELLEEEITAFEDYVQSVDIVSFNKI